MYIIVCLHLHVTVYEVESDSKEIFFCVCEVREDAIQNYITYV